MANRKTVHVPAGYTLQLVTDAVSSGTYTRLGDPGGVAYTPTAIAASTDTTIGPFNEPRNYALDATNTGITDTLAYSGYLTGADDTAIGLLAPKASPTFTGTVVLPATTSIATVSGAEIGYLDGVSSAIQTQIDTKRPWTDTVTEYLIDGAISFSLQSQIAVLTKETAGAYTLAAPTTGTHDGRLLKITSTTDAAHVVTATGLILDGVTGGAKNTATFAAFSGASITLMAMKAKWHVIDLNAVTVA